MTTHTPTTEEIGNKMADICNQWEALYDKAAAERNELREQRDELFEIAKTALIFAERNERESASSEFSAGASALVNRIRAAIARCKS